MAITPFSAGGELAIERFEIVEIVMEGNLDRFYGRTITYEVIFLSVPSILVHLGFEPQLSKAIFNFNNTIGILLGSAAPYMDSRPRLYLCTAFLCGVLLTLGFKDFYPDLERRFRRRRVPINSIAGAGLASRDQIDLEDHTKSIKAADTQDVEIGEGIEACVGNTPLFRIKSLSEETGCDILGKAEVDLDNLEITEFNRMSDLWLVP